LERRDASAYDNDVLARELLGGAVVRRVLLPALEPLGPGDIGHIGTGWNVADRSSRLRVLNQMP